MSFPNVPSKGARGFLHKHLKVVELVGLIGFAYEEYFLKRLLKVAPSLEMVSVDTQSDVYKDVPVCFSNYPGMISCLTRENSKQAINRLESKCPPKANMIILDAALNYSLLFWNGIWTENEKHSYEIFIYFIFYGAMIFECCNFTISFLCICIFEPNVFKSCNLLSSKIGLKHIL